MALTEQQLASAFERIGPRMTRRFLRWTGGNRSLSEDLVQRTFTVAWAKREAFVDSSDDQVDAWIWTIARYEQLAQFKRNLRSREELGKPPAQEPDPLEWPITRLYAADELLACFRKLKRVDQRILQLRYGLHPRLLQTDNSATKAQGSTEAHEPVAPLIDKEIAEELPSQDGRPRNAASIKRRRHRAIEALRACLTHQRGGGSARTGHGDPGGSRGGSGNMAQNRVGGLVSNTQLWEILDDPDGKASSEIRSALDGDPTASQRLHELLCVEASLIAANWPDEPALEAPGGDQASLGLSERQRALFQTIVMPAAEAAQRGLHLIASEAQSTSGQRRSTRPSATYAMGSLALAASLIVGIAVWRHQPSLLLEGLQPTPTGDLMKGGSEATEAPALIPLSLLIYNPALEPTHNETPEAMQIVDPTIPKEIRPNVWAIDIPEGALFKIRVGRPSKVRADTWSIEGRFHATNSQSSLRGFPALTGEAHRTQSHLDLSRTINMSKLQANFPPELQGQPFDVKISVEGQTYTLRITPTREAPQ